MHCALHALYNIIWVGREKKKQIQRRACVNYFPVICLTDLLFHLNMYNKQYMILKMGKTNGMNDVIIQSPF